MLAVRNISKSFRGRPVLSGLDAEFEEGSVTAIIGPNGSGKSTLLRMLWGEIKPDSGDMLWNGAALDPSSAAWKSLLGAVPDDDALVEGLSIRGHFRLCGALSGLSAKDSDERADHLMALFGLEEAERSTRTAFEASRGNRKRLACALALMGRPRVALMDEPFSGLDAERADALAAVLRLLADRGLAVAFSCHDDGLTRAAADRFVLIREGKAQSGAIADLPGRGTGRLELGGALPWLG